MKPAETAFLPAAWRSVERGSRDGEPYEYLWLLSRGPMSHGCTHLNAGHISELRQMLPAETEQLYQVDLFLNTSYLYDVFDIDGDLEPEVMGVRYFIAYSLKDNKPDRLRVRNERHAYYDWLYGGELELRRRDRGVLPQRQGLSLRRPRRPSTAPSTSASRCAKPTTSRRRSSSTGWSTFPFARELRKVGVSHRFSAPVPERNIASNRQRLRELPEEYR